MREYEYILKVDGDASHTPICNDRLYSMAEGMIPCQCCAPVALTRPRKHAYFHGDEEYTAIVFRAICTNCYEMHSFVWSEEFYNDYTI